MTMSQDNYRIRRDSLPQTNQSKDRENIPLASHASMRSPIKLNPGAREQRWFHEHEDELTTQYAGRWIAVSGDTVLGAADDARAAYEQAKTRGFPDVAVIQVPERTGEWDNLFF